MHECHVRAVIRAYSVLDVKYLMILIRNKQTYLYAPNCITLEIIRSKDVFPPDVSLISSSRK